jgi:hypothetical protein
MKQKLKFPAFVLFVLFLLFVVVGLFLPGKTNVSRSIVIKAEPAVVMPHITSFKNWLAWMPWNKETDPTIEIRREGPESGVGAIHTWTSEKSGNGKLEIVAVEGNISMGYHCFFDGATTPSLGSFDLEANGNGTKVTWSFTILLGPQSVSALHRPDDVRYARKGFRPRPGKAEGGGRKHPGRKG